MYTKDWLAKLTVKLILVKQIKDWDVVEKLRKGLQKAWNGIFSVKILIS